jgi:putative membrane protein
MVRSRFTPDEQQRIDAALAAIEQGTSADLDVMVTRASDHYSLYPLVWAGAAALLLAGLITLLRSGLSGHTILVIQLIVLIGLIPLFDWLPMRLRLVPAHVKRARARQLAHREFDAHFTGVKSRRNRILLFVSLGEHYVEIIADHDTHARVPAEVWNKVLEDLVAAVKAGRVANGLLAAIDSCGTLLKSHYQDLGDRPDRH